MKASSYQVYNKRGNSDSKAIPKYIFKMGRV